MWKKTVKKISVVVIIFLLIGTTTILSEAYSLKQSHAIQNENISKNEQEPLMATVSFQHYDPIQKKMIQQPTSSLSIQDAYDLRDKLQALEESCHSSYEKIQAQIQLLSSYQILPESFDTKIYERVKYAEKNYASNNTRTTSVSPNVIICGPTVTSFLTIGGPILPLHVLFFSILKPYWYNTSMMELDFANGALISGFLGLMPMVAFYCTATTLINAFGAVIGEQTVISPFIALMLMHAGAGVSISINSNGFPINIFDWAIGLSITGLIAYIDIMS